MKKILTLAFCVLTLATVGCGSGSSSASASSTVKNASSAPK